VSNHLVAAANDEYKLFTTGKRRERVTARLNRVEVFLKYLADEETRENVEFGLALGADDMFTTKASSEFALERKRVEVSAAKQAARRAGRP
jgi:hypothetical protein